MSQRQSLRISPVAAPPPVELALTRVGRHHDVIQEVGERLLESLQAGYSNARAERLSGTVTQPDLLHPSTSELETRKQFEDLQRFLFQVSLQDDFFDRFHNASLAWNLLRQNEALLRIIATRPGEFGYPRPDQLKAVIVTEDLASAALGGARTPRHYMSAAGRTLTAEDARFIQSRQIETLYGTSLRVPRAEFLVQPDVATLLRYLGWSGANVCTPDDPIPGRTR